MILRAKRDYNIDEIDKSPGNQNPSITRDVSVKVSTGSAENTGRNCTVFTGWQAPTRIYQIDTTNILFIAGGPDGLENNKPRISSKVMGFGAEILGKAENLRGIENILPEDLLNMV